MSSALVLVRTFEPVDKPRPKGNNLYIHTLSKVRELFQFLANYLRHFL